MLSLRVGGFKSDSPNPVVWTRVDQYLVAGTEQERPQGFVLAQLCHVPFGDELAAVRLPHIVVEVLHLREFATSVRSGI